MMYDVAAINLYTNSVIYIQKFASEDEAYAFIKAINDLIIPLHIKYIKYGWA